MVCSSKQLAGFHMIESLVFLGLDCSGVHLYFRLIQKVCLLSTTNEKLTNEPTSFASPLTGFVYGWNIGFLRGILSIFQITYMA